MLVTAVVPIVQVVDVRCDVCGDSTTTSSPKREYGTLHAHWGYGSAQHDGEQYEIHLCEDCFFETLANLRQMHRGKNMFLEGYQPAEPDVFGRLFPYEI